MMKTADLVTASMSLVCWAGLALYVVVSWYDAKHTYFAC